MENLTRKEIDTLVDALEAWEQRDIGGEILLSLMEAMFTKDDPVAREEMKKEEKKRKDEAEMQQRERKETSLLLKAKLIQMKAGLLVDDANKILQSQFQKNL